LIADAYKVNFLEKGTSGIYGMYSTMKILFIGESWKPGNNFKKRNKYFA